MSDIFISYSSKDRAQAEQLTELLASAGLSVWIDKQGIDVATSWSGEIVDAIEGCKAFVVLLSPNSVESVNVVKEVSLAAGQKKKILPLDLEPVELPRDLKYHLAGIQRAPMTNIDAIIRAIGKLGLEATKAPEITLVKETSDKKSLMILPFEDLSPTADNGWFADGIVSELIQSLTNIKSLHIADAQATKEFKTYKGQLSVYAREMSIRYFVQGDVRKFGDQIKINTRLLDIQTGDYLWQDTHKGTMADVFEIQEKVAEKVVEGLKLHLTSDEKQKLSERGTENTEAYELLLKANEYFERHTKEGFQIAAQLASEAIRLDTSYANAYQFKANTLPNLYRGYDRDPAFLEEAERLCREALRIKPDLASTYKPLSMIYTLQGKHAEAEAAAREYIRREPEDSSSHFALGFFFSSIGERAKAIAHYEEAVRLKPERPALFNLVLSCDAAKETEKCRKWALVALPVEERYLKLHPDDENSRMKYSILLFCSGRLEAARLEAMKLKQARDGATLYNTANTFIKLGDKTEALECFRKAIDAGYRDIRHLKNFLNDEDEGIAQLRGTPEYEEVKRMVEKIEKEAEEAKNNG